MRIRVIGIGLLLLSVSVSAQWRYVKTEAEVTVAGTAVALLTAADVQAGSGHPAAQVANCSLSGANIRVTYDGTTPTTSVGQVLTPGNYIITGPDVLLNLKGIRDDSTSATWNCIVQGN